MTGPEYTGTLEDIDGNIYKIFMDVYTMNAPQSPKLVFKRVESYTYPPALSYGMEYAPGTFTMSGLRPEHTDVLAEWCTRHSCGVVDTRQMQIVFNTEEEMVWFLLRWK